jgi:glutamyl-tRNA reductase
MPFVLGLNHESAPIGIREKMAVSPHALPQTLESWKSKANVDEIVCLSTCNRMEVYAQSKNHEASRQALEQLLEAHAGVSTLPQHLYYHEGDETVHHLFSVASGLDSMVKGEHEILAQVKQAYQAAQEGGFTGKLLNVLFQRSLYVGKRVRTETGLGEGGASVGSIAVGMAARIFGDLREKQIMILGAGEMAEATARHLMAQNAKSILVANRTFDRACDLAKAFGGSALHFEEGLRKMVDVDIVICSTAAPRAVITTPRMKQVMEARKGRSLFLVDIAMPRDVDPAVNDIENVYLYNIDDLEHIVAANTASRAKEAELAKRIVEAETHEFSRWLKGYREGTLTGLKHKSPTSSLSSVQ